MKKGTADYRITLSFDEVCGNVTRNTSFVEGATQIMGPLEEVVEVPLSEEAMTVMGAVNLNNEPEHKGRPKS